MRSKTRVSFFHLRTQGKVPPLLVCASHGGKGSEHAVSYRHTCSGGLVPMATEAAPALEWGCYALCLCSMWTSLPWRCWSSLCHKYLWLLLTKHQWGWVWPEVMPFRKGSVPSLQSSLSCTLTFKTIAGIADCEPYFLILPPFLFIWGWMIKGIIIVWISHLKSFHT